MGLISQRNNIIKCLAAPAYTHTHTHFSHTPVQNAVKRLATVARAKLIIPMCNPAVDWQLGEKKESFDTFHICTHAARAERYLRKERMWSNFVAKSARV